MKISQIKQIGKSTKFHVYVDGEWFGIFMDEILARYKLKTSQEIDDELMQEIKEENDERLSFDLAVSYIEKYSVSEKGIRDYLKKKSFKPQTVEKTIEKLKSYDLVDDEKFAKNYFESFASSKGRRVIANKLKEKGIAQEIIDDLLSQIDEEDELAKAVVLAEKFVKKLENNLKTKQKCLAHLIYKGYDYNVAQQATNIALENKGEDL